MKVVKIIPQPEELQIVNRQNQGILKCTEIGCNYVASSSSAIGLHKAKIHNIKSVSEDGVDKHYHCPVASCYYNPQSVRYFKSIDFLKTHFMKVHSEKKFKCKKCDKTFGLERDCLRHERECGETFFCPDCKKTFNSKPALFRHCDYNRHKKPELTKKVTPTSAKVMQHPKGKKEDKRKPLQVNRKALPFILPKSTAVPVLYSPSSLQQHSLQIQTDEMGAQYIISKMASEHSVSQSVQTIEKVNSSLTKTAGIQTVPQTWSRLNVNNNNQITKLSTGIQTAEPQIGNLSVAQTQTGETILQKAMKAASIPVVKVCKATQKSPGKSNKGKRKSSGTCTSESQTYSQQTPRKKLCRNYFKSVNLLSRSPSFTDPMSTMSTQTNLSCVPFLTQQHSFGSGMQLQDCHTQTTIDNDPHFTHNFNNQNTQTINLLSINDQVTQTTLHCVSNDQKTQTSSCHFRPCDVFGDLTIQDSQTQTLQSLTGTGIINDSQTQTQISGINMSPEQHDQGTTCDGLFNLNIESSSAEAFSLLPLSFQNTATEPILMDKSNFYSRKSIPVMKDVSFNSDDGIREDCPLQMAKSSSLVSSDSTEALADLLMEVIDQSENSQKDPSTSRAQGTFLPTSQADANMNSMVENTDACVKLQNVTSMETQTFGSLGMDSMTQTMDDLVFEIGTQTVEDLVADMMTQTGDDLLEYLTNDTHTQTLDDYYGHLASAYSGKSLDASTSEISTQINLTALFGDNASTQTIWDVDDQALDLHSSSFAAPWNSSFSNVGRGSQTRPGSFLDGECKPDAAWNNGQYQRILNDEVYAFTTVSSTLETKEAQIDAHDLDNDINDKVTESSQTQTVYDPLFSQLDSDSPQMFEYDLSLKPKTYKESSHTQTNFDPLLSSIMQDDDVVLSSQQNIFVQKETSETQTLAKIQCPSRETAQCQTSWDDFITSVETSETQTYNEDLFNNSLISSTDSDTQTQSQSAECQTSWNDFITHVETSETQTYNNADLFDNSFLSSTDSNTQTQSDKDLVQRQNLDFTDSFTQTSLDQNTQTALKTLKEFM